MSTTHSEIWHCRVSDRDLPVLVAKCRHVLNGAHTGCDGRLGFEDSVSWYMVWSPAEPAAVVGHMSASLLLDTCLLWERPTPFNSLDPGFALRPVPPISSCGGCQTQIVWCAWCSRPAFDNSYTLSTSQVLHSGAFLIIDRLHTARSSLQRERDQHLA